MDRRALAQTRGSDRKNGWRHRAVPVPPRSRHECAVSLRTAFPLRRGREPPLGLVRILLPETGEGGHAPPLEASEPGAALLAVAPEARSLRCPETVLSLIHISEPTRLLS